MVTDSFHGMCLALIFEKPFIAISNEKRGAVRFRELLSRLKLEGRLLEDPSDLTVFQELVKAPVDYEKVSELISEEKKFSINWLLSSLDSVKKCRYGEGDYLTERIDETETVLHDLQSEHQRILDWHTGRLDYGDKIREWHTSRLDYGDKIREWHTSRLDYNDGIRDRHAERLDEQQKTIDQMKQELKELKKEFFGIRETVDNLPAVMMKKKIQSLGKQHGQDLKRRGQKNG